MAARQLQLVLAAFAAGLDPRPHCIGSATLAENIDTVAVPPNMAPILGETRDPSLRETLRDIGCAQSFRRELCRKGIAPLPAVQQQLLLEGMTFARLGSRRRKGASPLPRRSAV